MTALKVLDVMNCICGSNPVALRFGVERCGDCDKLAGADVFVAFGAPLPTRARNRKIVSP
jgi:hypothetical protein